MSNQPSDKPDSDLIAQFEMRYAGGATIAADLRQAMDTFSVTVLFGPSGCGKTTVLRSLAGLERPHRGEITCGQATWFSAERRICQLPQARDIGYLFQDYALFPHCTVAENVAFGLRTWEPPKRQERMREVIELLELHGLEHRYPHEISGGQQQRVALARTLARKPRLLLLDEPLSALDAALRERLRGQLRRLLEGLGVPVVLVTHDRSEAIALADQVIVMDAGRVRQTSSVQDVFSRPVDSEVARIVGVETVAAGEVLEIEQGLATVRVGSATLLAVAPDALFTDGSAKLVYVCLRGEDVTLQRQATGGSSARNHLPARVKWITPEGPLVRVGLDCGFELTALVTRPACEELRLSVGETIAAVFKAPAIHLVARKG